MQSNCTKNRGVLTRSGASEAASDRPIASGSKIEAAGAGRVAGGFRAADNARMSPTLADLLAEREALRAMLGEPGEPVYLDLKPGPLTAQERERFTRRLRLVADEIEWATATTRGGR